MRVLSISILFILVTSSCNREQLDPGTEVSGTVAFRDNYEVIANAKVYLLGLYQERGVNPNVAAYEVWRDSTFTDSAGYFSFTVPHRDSVEYFDINLRFGKNFEFFKSAGNLDCNNGCHLIPAGNTYEKEVLVYR